MIMTLILSECSSNRNHWYAFKRKRVFATADNVFEKISESLETIIKIVYNLLAVN